MYSLIYSRRDSLAVRLDVRRGDHPRRGLPRMEERRARGGSPDLGSGAQGLLRVAERARA
jgi:hypothetical protein